MTNSRFMFRVLPSVSALMLFAAVLKSPYTYYSVLRIVVFCTALWLVFVEPKDSIASMVWSALFCFVAIMFNPVVPIHMKRGTWFYFDIGSGIAFVGYMLQTQIKRYKI